MSATRTEPTFAPPYGEVIRLAVPAALAAAVTPLLGAIDVWALARSPRPLDIAAVGLASVIFSLAYWTFGFIRMSVAGLTAQAAGAGDAAEETASLLRGAAIGAGVGAALVILQGLIAALAMPLLGAGSEASAETLAGARAYFHIRIWGAPFALAGYALFGYLTAKGRTDYLFAVSFAAAAINAGLDVWFVNGLGWGPLGVAAGTAIAEICAFLLALALAMRTRRADSQALAVALRTLLEPTALRRTLSVNRDIFIRTLLLAASFAWFVQRGGAFGDVTLAANQALLQLFLLTGLALDGTAVAAETLVGRAVGARDAASGARRIRAAVIATFAPAVGVACLFALVYALFGDALIGLIAGEGQVREAAGAHWGWIVASPLVVVTAFQLDGVFIGATRAREMRNSMIVSAGAFLILSVALAGRFGNDGLWAAFSLYFLLRAATLGAYLPRILNPSLR